MFRERFVKSDVAIFTDDLLQFLGDDKIGGQNRQLFVNIARAEAENEIARLEHVANVAMHPFQPRLVTHAAMAVRRDFVGDHLTADAWNRGFIRSVDVSDDDAICLIERAPKLLP